MRREPSSSRRPAASTGRTSFVEGSQYLFTGSYAFICRVHPFMTGTLTVTGAGTPVPLHGTARDAAGTARAVSVSGRLRK